MNNLKKLIQYIINEFNGIIYEVNNLEFKSLSFLLLRLIYSLLIIISLIGIFQLINFLIIKILIFVLKFDLLSKVGL